MRLVVQRVARAEVRTGDDRRAIGLGALVLAGVGMTDGEATVDRAADRLVGLRYFEDEEGRTNRAIAEVGGAFLVVSQFTLYADLRRGRRPGFTDAARTEVAAPLVERFAARLRSHGVTVETGRFGAAMEVELVNDGPFTLVLDTERDSFGT